MFDQFDHGNIAAAPLPSQSGEIAPRQSLRALGADRIVHFRDPHENTYLHWGIKTGLPFADLKDLIDRGSDVNAVNTSGESVLFCAVRFGKEKLVEILLDRGADPTVATNEGLSPLVVALDNGHSAVVEMLLANGTTRDQAQAVA